jgi:hypothetical protein
VKVAVLMDAEAIASLKVAVKAEATDTFVALFRGVVDTTLGGGAAVVKLHT